MLPRPIGPRVRQEARGAGLDAAADTPGGRTDSLGDAGAEPTPSLGVLGEYELLERLGSGGMGEVYRARHRRLNRLVALKVLAGRRDPSPEVATRFRREMAAVGRTDHPNVVEALDAGEHEGVAFLVMKLVDGVNLNRLVKEEGPLPVAEACELARQAALGLAHLHECDLVHRDIKPSNLMRSADGTVKVVDLGVARWQGEMAGHAELTLQGQLLGTPDFMAPEQARNPVGVDGRADVYSLGATLFFLLVGHAPFADHRNPLDKLQAHAHEASPDLKELRPEVPDALAELVDALLAKEPDDRPGSSAEVADALATFAGPPERSPLLPWERRAQGALAAVLVALCAALALTAALSRAPAWLKASATPVETERR